MSYTRRRYKRDERPPASTFATTSSVASSSANALTVCHASYTRGSCTLSSSTAGTSALRRTGGGGVRVTAGARGGYPKDRPPPAPASGGRVGPPGGGGAGRAVFVVMGAILGGGAIVVAARRLEQPVEFAGRHVLRAHEHDVLEQMGEPGAAGPLVRRADVVPGVHRHHRHGVVLVQEPLQPVGKRERRVGNPEGLGGQAGGAREAEHQGGRKRHAGHHHSSDS